VQILREFVTLSDSFACDIARLPYLSKTDRRCLAKSPSAMDVLSFIMKL